MTSNRAFHREKRPSHQVSKLCLLPLSPRRTQASPTTPPQFLPLTRTNLQSRRKIGSQEYRLRHNRRPSRPYFPTGPLPIISSTRLDKLAALAVPILLSEWRLTHCMEEMVRGRTRAATGSCPAVLISP